jgi:hypothetical protein
VKRVRVIPVLLLKDGGLVKSVKFQKHQYVGDPINTVRIFNEKEVDELVLLDIGATARGNGPDLERVREIVSEAFMPMAYGGGVTTVDQIAALIQGGVEKVALNTAAVLNPDLVGAAARRIGSQSVVVSIDARKDLWGRYRVYSHGGARKHDLDPAAFAADGSRRRRRDPAHRDRPRRHLRRVRPRAHPPRFRSVHHPGRRLRRRRQPRRFSRRGSGRRLGRRGRQHVRVSTATPGGAYKLSEGDC